MQFESLCSIGRYCDPEKYLRHSWAVRPPASLSAGPGFESRPEHQLKWQLILLVFLSSSKLLMGLYLKIGHDPFHIIS